jgi:hypothetical protein
MKGWKMFCGYIHANNFNTEIIKKLATENFNDYKVYPDSIHYAEGSLFFIARDGNRKILVIYSESTVYKEFIGNETNIDTIKVKSCELSYENCILIRKVFPFTNPLSHKGHMTTIGLGDRLGLASAGHLRLLKDKPVFPVLAQQSMRELNLTGRNYNDVLSAASWSVFQEGYEKGFGADGDHLKTAAEVKMAIDCGYTMITLDCSEHIDNEIASSTSDEIDSKYAQIPKTKREYIESKFLDKKFQLECGIEIAFAAEELKKIALIYLNAVDFAIDIFKGTIQTCGRNIDFEMSIDETLTATSPESHFFVASELLSAGVEITSIAPRFCGEFQKGIDYRGDIVNFEKEFDMHFKIAEHFGYKISVHSGSDKFSVFPIIAEKTKGKYHLKTAGTNWLEAVRVIAKEKPSLYRKMHKFALLNLQKAKKYYHITADPLMIPDIDMMDDSKLPDLMDMDDARQILHITYGLILSDKKPDGTTTFKNEIYDVLNENEEEYYNALFKHIGKHLSCLKI